MRSTGSSRSVIVGLFALIGIAILAVTILTLGNQSKLFIKPITVTSYFSDVKGLQAGNNVWFGGVKVGNVERISFMKDGNIEVKMNIDKSVKEYVHKDVRSKLSSDGFIGNKIVELFGGTMSAPLIANGDIIAADEAGGVDEMMDKLALNNDNILGITDNLKSITAQMAEGSGTLGMLINDKTLMNQILDLTASLGKSADHLQEVTKAASDFGQKLNEPGLVNDLMTDTIVFSNLRQITYRLNEITDSSQAMMNNLNSMSATLKDATKDTETPIGMLVNDKETSENIKSTLSNLESATQKLDEDLEALQHNFLFRKYFKKKAKTQERVIIDTIVGQ